MKYILLAALALSSASPLFAQQSLDEAIAVDGRYAAEVIPMDRIPAFPAEFPLSMESPRLDYDLSPLRADFSPSFFPLPLPNLANPLHRGYLDLAAGSWLDASIKAGAWFLPPSASSPWTAGAWLSHDSSSLWKPDFNNNLSYKKRADYNEAVGFVGARRLNNGSSLSARLDYGLRYFNYFMSPQAPSQTVNRFNASLNWSSAPFASLRHYLDLSVSHFSFRDVPFISPANLWAPSRQTTLQLSGSVSAPVQGVPETDSDRLSLRGSLSGVFGAPVSNYGLLSLSPAYSFVFNQIHVNAGLNLDFSAKAGSEADPFSAFHIAPAFKVWLPTNHFTFFASVLGGSELRTLESEYTLSHFASPVQFSHTPVFSPVDAALGFNAGPAQGFLRGLEGGLKLRYKAVSHLPLYGWFPAAVALGGVEGAELLAANAASTSLHGFEVSGRLAYSFRSLAKAELNLAYSPQHSHTGFFNGIDRSRWVGNFSIAVSPIEKLSLSLAAQWRAVRYIYGFNISEASEHSVLSDLSELSELSVLSVLSEHSVLSDNTLTGCRLPDWFSLKFEADYHLSKTLSFGAGVYNITNRRNWQLPALPTEGITLAARLSLLF